MPRPHVSFDVEVFDGLLAGGVQGERLVGGGGEVDGLEVDAPDGGIVGGFVIYFAVGEVGGRCPLGGTGDVGGLAEGVFNADGDVEVVEDVEAFQDGFEGCGALGGCGPVEGDAHETGGGVMSPGMPRNPAPEPKGAKVRSLRAWGATPPGVRLT